MTSGGGGSGSSGSGSGSSSSSSSSSSSGGGGSSASDALRALARLPADAPAPVARAVLDAVCAAAAARGGADRPAFAAAARDGGAGARLADLAGRGDLGLASPAAARGVVGALGALMTSGPDRSVAARGALGRSVVAALAAIIARGANAPCITAFELMRSVLGDARGALNGAAVAAGLPRAWAAAVVVAAAGGGCGVDDAAAMLGAGAALLEVEDADAVVWEETLGGAPEVLVGAAARMLGAHVASARVAEGGAALLKCIAAGPMAFRGAARAGAAVVRSNPAEYGVGAVVRGGGLPPLAAALSLHPGDHAAAEQTVTAFIKVSLGGGTGELVRTGLMPGVLRGVCAAVRAGHADAGMYAKCFMLLGNFLGGGMPSEALRPLRLARDVVRALVALHASDTYVVLSAATLLQLEPVLPDANACGGDDAAAAAARALVAAWSPRAQPQVRTVILAALARIARVCEPGGGGGTPRLAGYLCDDPAFTAFVSGAGAGAGADVARICVGIVAHVADLRQVLQCWKAT